MDVAKLTAIQKNSLRRMTLLRHLPRPMAQELIARARSKKVARGAELFSAGELANCSYGVLDGWVKLFDRTCQGEEMVFGLFNSGETFGEAEVLTGGCYYARAQAVIDCELCLFDKQMLDDLSTASPEFCRGMLATLSEHLTCMSQNLEQLQTRNAEERLVQFLLSLCKSTGAGACHLKLPYEKSLIAYRLGMKPETLSRCFTKLRSIGVEVHAKQITVRNPESLAKRLPGGTRLS
jgi:CRP-like cAMP-binding protein